MACATRNRARVGPALLAQPQQHVSRAKHREGTRAALNDDGSGAVHVFAHAEKIWNSGSSGAKWIIG
jgi:hypothetical protein